LTAADLGVWGFGAWNPGGFEVKAGFGNLPSADWGTLGFNNEGSYATGATAGPSVYYMQFAARGFHIGLNSGDTTGKLAGAKSPGFHLGYDYTGGDAGLGATFTGWYKDTGVFPFLATVRGSVKIGGPGVSFNAGIWKNPKEFSAPVTFNVDSGDEFVFEGRVGVTVPVSGSAVVVTGGYLHAFDSEDNHIQLGCAFKADIAGGFALIPGVVYTNKLSKGGEDEKSSDVVLGVTLKYNF
jgi:hypothetical protein